MVFGKDGKLYFSVGERGNEKKIPKAFHAILEKFIVLTMMAQFLKTILL
jgi:glucose/arabinose dehydrogenase